MVDYLGLGKAVLWMFFGIIFTAVAWYTIPVVIDIIPASATYARGLGWFSVLMVSFFLLIIIPAYHIIKSTKGT